MSSRSMNDLKNMAKMLGIPVRRTKSDMLADIRDELNKSEPLKKTASHSKSKYIKGDQIGNTGKDGKTYIVQNKKGSSFAMKTFKKNKSIKKIQLEYDLQKIAAAENISPSLIDIDLDEKYIVMDKMDHHLMEVLEKQKGHLSKKHQRRIVSIYKTLDAIGVFHGDANLTNYMIKDRVVYIIDFGLGKYITPKLEKKMGTEDPNLKLMLIGFILKLKEMNCPSDSWSVLSKYVDQSSCDYFDL